MKAHFWFSQKQWDRQRKENPLIATFAKLESGTVVQYTTYRLSKNPKKPSPVGFPKSFDDFVYLGYGVYDHSEKIKNTKTKGRVPNHTPTNNPQPQGE